MLEEKKDLLRTLLKGLSILKDKKLTGNLLQSIDKIV